MKQFFLFLLIGLVFASSLYAQQVDSTVIKTDSLPTLPIVDQADTVKADIIKVPLVKFKNKILNEASPSVSFAEQYKNIKSLDMLFYLVIAIVLLLALFKSFYSKYFTNLFKVFFNSSLRQNQLTDQLLQAKLPSLLFNIFFIVSAGLYVYILLQQFQLINNDTSWLIILASIAVLGVIYLAKFCALKFTGWVTGLNEATNTYIFIIFLINKIIGIFLIPFTIIIAFSAPGIVEIATLISLMCIGVFLLLRFFRSYGLLQNQLKISRFHFILYIAGIELLPLLLIYKGLMLYLGKNL